MIMQIGLIEIILRSNSLKLIMPWAQLKKLFEKLSLEIQIIVQIVAISDKTS